MDMKEHTIYFNGAVDIGLLYEYALSLCSFKDLTIETNQLKLDYADAASPSLFICENEYREEDGLWYDYMVAILGENMNRRTRLIKEYVQNKTAHIAVGQSEKVKIV